MTTGEAQQRRQVIEADLTYVAGQFHRGYQIAIESDGRIAQVGPLGYPATRRLASRAILPGMVNVHSHAFQRGLRGLGEYFPAGAGDFWSWREAMYDLVEHLDEERFRHLCALAFSEMLASGITTVGEFHYVHHDTSGRGFAYDPIILEVAQQVGIRICLLCCYYRTGGIHQPLKGGQRRFSTPDVGVFLTHVDSLRQQLRSPLQTLGIAPHSIRAVPREDFRPLADFARKNSVPLHIHVEEQPKEIEECLGAYGARPLEVILSEIEADPRLTAVHCTHSRPEDVMRLAKAGAHICACPLTEGNLGDGIAHTSAFFEAGGRICLGTDSNLQIDFAEDLRWLEYAQRLESGRRGVFRGHSGRNGIELFQYATRNGAASLQLDCGELTVGHWADFFTLDLDCASLNGCTEATLLDGYVFGSGKEAVREVCVGGRWMREVQ